MSSENEINALIQLLDDNDQKVYKHVRQKLKSLGAEIIPTLEQAWRADLNPTAHERIEEIIHEIQFESLLTEWKLWLTDENPDLFKGVFLIAKYHYPNIILEDIRKRIQKIKQTIWLELNYNQTPLEQIQIFNQVFYNNLGFKGSQTSSDFQDFCINNVIESKKGNSISIGVIYQILAAELTLPVYGVVLLRHYILAFCKKVIFDFTSEKNLECEVMFYVNPVNRGSVFSRNEIKDYLTKMKVEHEPQFFSPADNNAIVIELLKNLIEIYEQQNRYERLKDFNTLLQILEAK